MIKNLNVCKLIRVKCRDNAYSLKNYLKNLCAPNTIIVNLTFSKLHAFYYII